MDDKKILIIDDCASTRALIRKTLNIHNTIEANNGIEGIMQIIEHSPCIILLDLQMPEMDGLEVLRYLRDNNVKSHIIVITAFEDEKILNDAFDAGADEILLKPIRPPILKAQVCRFIKALEYRKIMAAADELRALLDKAHNVLKYRGC